MNELAIFGICVGIVLLILMVIGLFFGPALFLLVVILPVALSEAITGERGTFSPNGSGRKSDLFKLLTAFFAFVQVLLLAALLYGIHRFLVGLTPGTPAIGTVSEASRPVLTPLEVERWQLVNGMLWLLCGSLVLMLLVNLFRFREQVKLMTKSTVFFGYVLPLIMHPLAIVYLASSRNYLTHYPDGDAYLGSFSKTVAIVYGIYLVGSQLREIHVYLSVLRKHQVQLKFPYWAGSGLGILYKVLFFYFLIGIFRSL